MWFVKVTVQESCLWQKKKKILPLGPQQTRTKWDSLCKNQVDSEIRHLIKVLCLEFWGGSQKWVSGLHFSGSSFLWKKTNICSEKGYCVLDTVLSASKRHLVKKSLLDTWVNWLLTLFFSGMQQSHCILTAPQNSWGPLFNTANLQVRRWLCPICLNLAPWWWLHGCLEHVCSSPVSQYLPEI